MTTPEPRVWENGTIFGSPVAEALYVEDGRIAAIGDRSTVRRSVATGTERIDLAGRCVIPGLVDAHLHVAASVRARTSLDLTGVRSIRELLARIEDHNAIHPGPLLGFGWDQELLAERRMPTRSDLDRVAPDQPVVLYRRCAHVATLNSAALAALAAAGVTEATPDPKDGAFGRSGGSVDGRLFDGAMSILPGLEERWFPLSPVGLREWLTEEARLGITAIGAMSVRPAELRVLHAASQTEHPSVDVHAYLRAPCPLDLGAERRALELPGFHLAGLKVMTDGSLGARTAHLARPYEDDPRSAGTSLVEPPELREILVATRAAGVATAVHAIGDQALSDALDAVEAVPGHAPVRIEHASVCPPILLDRLVDLRIPCAVQPSFVPSDSGMLLGRLGEGRSRWAYPFRSMMERGIALAGSSDSPIETHDPWRGLADAIAPRTAGPGGSEHLRAADALRLYTEGGRNILGVAGPAPLAPGTSADFVVLGARSWPEAIARGAASVEATYLGGRCTYRAGSSGGSQGL